MNAVVAASVKTVTAASQCRLKLRSLSNHVPSARVLLVGGGRMGQIRASLLKSNPRFNVQGVVDIEMDCAQSLGTKYGWKIFESLETALNEKTSLDAIILTTPTFTHQELIQQAADARISVFTEKPVEENADRIEQIFSYTEASGILLCCGFQKRFDPSFVAAKKAVREGQIGSPISANIFFGDHPGPSKEFLLTGGNIFMDLSVHDVDYITDTLQDDIVSVYAIGTSSDEELKAAGVHDNATMVMTMSKGAVVTLFMSRSATYGYDQSCQIVGTKGLATVENMPEHHAVVSNQSGILRSRLQHSFPQRFQQAYGFELDAFADTLIDGAPWPVTAEQCIKVQRVADAARLSCETGRIVEL